MHRTHPRYLRANTHQRKESAMVLDLNVASREELLDLPGIGEDRAQAILQARPFAALDDLLSVPGIGPIILHRVKERGVVLSGGPSPPRESEAGPVYVLSAGDQPMPGEEMASVGDAALMPGEEMAGVGEIAPMPGEEMAGVGEIAAMPGEEVAGVGEMAPMPGEEMAGVGEMAPMPGEEMAGVGDAAPMPGEEMAGMGDAAPMPGEEMASVGDAAPMPGERSIGAEEAQQIELTGRWRLTVALEPSDTSAQG
jgi:hypothetical protein